MVDAVALSVAVVAEFEPGGGSTPERSDLGLGGHGWVLKDTIYRWGKSFVLAVTEVSKLRRPDHDVCAYAG